MKLFRQSEKIVSPLYGYIRKGILIMKLTAILLLVFCMQVSAIAYAQKISLTEKNAKLTDVLDQIRQQSGYDIICRNDLLVKSAPVTVNLKGSSLEDAFKAILNNQELTYEIQDGTVIIKEKEQSFFDKIKEAIAAIDVKGRIVGEDGQPLAGATIIVKGGNNSTSADANGYFTLKNVAPDAILQISFMGFEKLEIKANAELGPIKMTVAQGKLDEVKIIAYGQTTERLSVGNSTTVTAKDIEKQPVSNPILALQGRVPGLFIKQTNGIPGSGVTVQIQGQNSISNGNDPFYVIDGVPYSSTVLQTSGPSGNGSPLNFINPSDIESISVLKDAVATAIYGSRAANGAIIITTKKGKAGETRVNVNLQNGWGKITRQMPLLTTQQYLDMRHEAIKNDGLTVQPTDVDINGTWDTTRYTDWQKQLIGGTSQYTNLNASISGGTENTQFLVGSTYHRETTVFPGNFDDKRANVHFNITTTSTNKKFKFQLSGNYLFEKNQLPGTDATQAAFILPPNAPSLFNTDGNINWALDSNGNSTWNYVGKQEYPLLGNYKPYTNNNTNLISNAVLSYQIFPGLEIKSNFGYTNQQVNETSLTPMISIEPAKLILGNFRSATYNRNSTFSWIIEPQVNYTKYWGKGRFDVLVGATIQQNGLTGTSLTGSGYSTDILLENPASATSISIASTSSQYKYSALFSRINYNWGEKYLLDITARRDGSSRFGAENQFHNFGAIGAGWIFSKENWVHENLTFLSFGKLKGSYGTTGNDQIGDYTFLSLYYSNPVNIPFQGISALNPGGLTNPYLQWEETRKMEFGLDLGLLNDRILLSGTFVRNRSSNQLLGYSLPMITGYSFVYENFPATVQNTAWEFSLNTINFKRDKFVWSSHLNLTIPHNKLIAYPDFASSPYASLYEIGKPLSIQKVFHFAGVNPTTGTYQFTNINGEITSNPDATIDNNVIIDMTPKFYGGFENNFNYKGFELSLFFQFVKQKGQNYAFGRYYPGNIYAGNQPSWVFNNRWQKVGDNTDIQLFGTDNRNQVQADDVQRSDANYVDASYIRLKNLSISKQLPEDWIKKAHFKDCKIFVQAQNLLTITSYKGLDPESPLGVYTGLPPLRVISVGLNATF